MNVAIQFRDLLRKYLVDPANRQGNWIFDNYPKEEFGQQPVITLIGSTSTGHPYSLGNTAWLGSQMLQVDIWVRDDTGYTIDNIPLFDKDLLIYLTDKLERVVRNYWIFLPISLIEMTDRTPISFNKDKLIWNLTLTFEVQAIEY